MQAKLTLSQWCEFCDFLKRYPSYRDHVKIRVINFNEREGRSYTSVADEASYYDCAVYDIEFTLNTVYTHYVMACNYHG